MEENRPPFGRVVGPVILPLLTIVLEEVGWIRPQRGLILRAGSRTRHPTSSHYRSEEVGFEPTVGCPTSVFETDAIGHSATLPCVAMILEKYSSGVNDSFDEVGWI